MEKKTTWQSLRNEYSWKAILDAFFAGLLFATVLYVPLVLILIELITVYMYLLTLFEILIIISLFAYVYAIHYFWHRSLWLKNRDHETNIRQLFLKNMLYVNLGVLVLGMVAMFVVIPILWK